MAIGEKIPAAATQAHLLSTKNSLKNLGKEYEDGWSVSYYDRNGNFITERGYKSSLIDPKFESAVNVAAGNESDIVTAHLRRASSGCVTGVPNPHPFERYLGGKHEGVWIFGHNGGIDKKLLIHLLGEDYINIHPPQVCLDDPPNSWIDSELYFMLLLKNIENSSDATEAIKNTLQSLYEYIEEKNRYLNFFLSNGKVVWAFRKGTSLFYKNENGRYYISSTIPEENDAQWSEFPENTLGIFTTNQKPQFIPIRESSSMQ